MKEDDKTSKQDHILTMNPKKILKDLFIALLFSSFALALLYAFEIVIRN